MQFMDGAVAWQADPTFRKKYAVSIFKFIELLFLNKVSASSWLHRALIVANSLFYQLMHTNYITKLLNHLQL